MDSHSGASLQARKQRLRRARLRQPRHRACAPRERQRACRNYGARRHPPCCALAHRFQGDSDAHERLRTCWRAMPETATSAVTIWPVRGPAAICAVARDSVATMDSVLMFAPPSAQEKQPRSKVIVCSTSPPSRMRTQRLLGTSAYQMAFSASRQMPSGTPTPRSAHTRRFDKLPSRAMSKAVSLLPYDSATIKVELSGVTTMPLGKAMPVIKIFVSVMDCSFDHRTPRIF